MVLLLEDQARDLWNPKWWTVTTGGAIGLALGAVWLANPYRWVRRHSFLVRVLVVFASLVAGAAAGFAAEWLLPAHAGWAGIGVVFTWAIPGVLSIIGWVLPNRWNLHPPKWVRRGRLLLLPLAPLGFPAFALVLTKLYGSDESFDALVSVLAVLAAPLALLVVNRLFDRVGSLRPFREAAVVTAVLVLVGVLVWWWRDHLFALYAALAVLATLALAVASILTSDYLHRARPTVYRIYTIPLVLMCWGGIVLILVRWLEQGIYARIGAGTLLAVGTLFGSVIFIYLFWIRAFTLLWGDHVHDGVEVPEAEAYFAWKQLGHPAPSDRVKNIAGLVAVEAWRKSSVLHSLISELFDPRVPPFYKNFLRLEVKGDELFIEAFGVTGSEPNPAEPAWSEMIGPVSLAARPCKRRCSRPLPTA